MARSHKLLCKTKLWVRVLVPNTVNRRALLKGPQLVCLFFFQRASKETTLIPAVGYRGGDRHLSTKLCRDTLSYTRLTYPSLQLAFRLFYVCTYIYIHACMHAYIHTYIHTYRHADMQTCRHADMQTDGLTNRTDRQTDRRTDGQANRRTDGQTYVLTHVRAYVWCISYIYI